MNISSASDCLPVSSASWQPFPSRHRRRSRSKRPPVSLDRFILLKGIPAGIALLLLSIPYGATTNYVAVYAREIGLHVPTGFFFTLMAVGMGISRIFAGKFVDRGYITQTISYGFYVVIAAFFLLSCCSTVIAYSEAWCSFIFYLVPFMLGIGFGVMFPAYNTLYVNLALTTNGNRHQYLSDFMGHRHRSGHLHGRLHRTAICLRRRLSVRQHTLRGFHAVFQPLCQPALPSQ